MHYIRIVGMLLLIASISGCANLNVGEGYLSIGEALTGKRVERTEDAMASWVGSDIDAVAAAWGPPSSVYTNKDGSKVYDYSYTITKTRAAQKNVYGQVLAPGESSSSTCNRAFLVAPDGVISKWKVTTPRTCEFTGKKVSKEIPIPQSTF
ncbi:hypothetical protein RAS12_04140 [Achromobacter seleniivolatilans]|uniref:Lipoprotein n=1 Tax=Achromobacter seleniivolatilans TaxID=3047478 RepID=A0ABY9M4M2_9BURK|nr:hypothetical protein [Achromobacter sp. R39]WMD21573.1 hypothetical protein RAS12_04140 [Achromobacter sp. R39]